jgi:hypothetical protein
MSQIKSQSAGAYFTAIVDKKKYTIKPDSEARTLIKKEISAYNLKNSQNRLKKILSLLKPKEEKAKQELLVVKKQLKNKEKNAKKEITEKSEAITNVVQAVEKIVEQKEEVKQEQLVQVQELTRYSRYVGYVHPVTGKVWNGEKYN